MPSAGFGLVTPETKRPQTYASDRAASEVVYLLKPGGKYMSHIP
jgi:hypothetical protein